MTTFLLLSNYSDSVVKTCKASTREEAIEIFDIFQNIIRDNWDNICDEAQLTKVDKSLFWGRQFLNPFSIEY